MSLTRIVRALFVWRIAGIVLALAGLLVLPGCWVASINPLYDEGTIENPHTDPDLVFDQSLIGSWSMADQKCTSLITIAAKDGGYDLQGASQGEGCSDDKFHRQARLVKLDAHYFLDIAPIDDDVCDMCLAKHDILLAKFDKDTLALTPIDSDWFKKSLATKVVTLTTVAGDTNTITASPKDLKAFCREFAENTEVFKPESPEKFRRK